MDVSTRAAAVLAAGLVAAVGIYACSSRYAATQPQQSVGFVFIVDRWTGAVAIAAPGAGDVSVRRSPMTPAP